MSPKAPNIGLHTIFLSPGRKPPVLSPGNTYLFAVKDNEIKFRHGEMIYSVFKHHQGWHMISRTPAGEPEEAAMRGEELRPDRNEIDDLIIIKTGDAFKVRLKQPEAALLLPTQPIEPPEQVRVSIRDTIVDPRIAIEMARVVAEDINVINYLELSNVEELKDGDILPGHKFVLGQPETYDREILAVNLGRTSAIYEVMQQAREIGSNHSGDRLSLALKIADMVDENYSALQGDGEEGMLLTLGFFQEKGGCCRHRAAELHLVLKQAGIRNRYIRGRVFGGWHAWVEVDVEEDGSFSYVIDPNKGIRGRRQKMTSKERKVMREILSARGLPMDKIEMYKVVDDRNDVEDGYFVERDSFNVVWRRREAPKPVLIEKEELLRLFGQGADVVRKNGVFILRQSAAKAGGPNVVYVTVVDRAAYDLYLAWLEKK